MDEINAKLNRTVPLCVDTFICADVMGEAMKKWVLLGCGIASVFLLSGCLSIGW
ncbi:hypothetical protein B194_5113 [Serratia plymuthica A30]|nr:hypothetical protein B194_5113 [Serratia plymuthica A30]